MNDEYGEDTSVNGWSSRTDGSSTATAEPVDRRWFEEALRAQGFLVEPPALDEPVLWDEAPAIEPPRPETLYLDVEDAGFDDEPLTVEADPSDTQSDAVAAELMGPAEADESEAPDGDAEQAGTAQASVDDPLTAATDWSTDPEIAATSPVTAWPVFAGTPARLGATPAVDPVVVPAAAATRQPVAPSTLSVGTSPVPTAALAARLSRGVGAPTAPGPVTNEVRPPTPDSVEPATATTTQSEPDRPPVASTSTVAVVVTPETESTAIPPAAVATPIPADPWTLPALQADLAAERLAEPMVAIGVPSTADVVDASSAEVTARQEADLQAQAAPVDASVSVEAASPAPELVVSETVDAPSEPIGARGEPLPVPAEAIAATALASASVAPQPSSPFAPPVTGIGAIAPRPPTTVGTTVDGGESDLWGLVDDPRKAATEATTAAAATSSSRMTTIVLTVIVAFVVVALVLGFLYLLGSLL